VALTAALEQLHWQLLTAADIKCLLGTGSTYSAPCADPLKASRDSHPTAAAAAASAAAASAAVDGNQHGVNSHN